MNWSNDVIILSRRFFSESAQIITLFDRSYGKISSLLRTTKISVQKGDISHVFWRGRTSESLGNIVVENIFSPYVYAMNSVTKIYAIDSICSLCSIGLPEKAPHPQIFDALYKIFISIKNDNWLKQYALFELLFLAQMGFGLDLTKCAVTGSRENLYYISPKTGRAVTKEVGNLYKNKLFIIPKFFLHEDVGASDDEIYSALMITGHFLNIYFYNINGGKLPIARNYLLTEFHKQIFGEKIA